MVVANWSLRRDREGVFCFAKLHARREEWVGIPSSPCIPPDLAPGRICGNALSIADGESWWLALNAWNAVLRFDELFGTGTVERDLKALESVSLNVTAQNSCCDTAGAPSNPLEPRTAGQ